MSEPLENASETRKSAPPEARPLHQFTPGQTGDCYAVLCERARRTTRAGRPFFSLKFRDRFRTVSAPLWEDHALFGACDAEWKIGQHFKLRATYKDNPTYGPQLEILNARLATPQDTAHGYDPAQLEPRTRFDVEGLYSELLRQAALIQDKPLCQLVTLLLEEHRPSLLIMPAATWAHHNYGGGLLEHVVSVTRTGIYFADKYREYYPDLQPSLNKDLIIAGCLLHDIGKVHELSANGDETGYTVVGHLIGHILIGRDMVRDAARAIEGLNPELLLYLEHIITAHQGTPEWGSPKEPMLPEAMLVHFADDVDAKMNTFVSIIQSSETDSPFSDKNNILRRRLLKQRGV